MDVITLEQIFFPPQFRHHYIHCLFSLLKEVFENISTLYIEILELFNLTNSNY